MKALTPAAGQGTRLYPQTHTKPKVMVHLAGRPILDHIFDSLVTTDIDEGLLNVVDTDSGSTHEPLPQIRYPDITKITAAFDWESDVPLWEGLRRTVADYRELL